MASAGQRSPIRTPQIPLTTASTLPACGGAVRGPAAEAPPRNTSAPDIRPDKPAATCFRRVAQASVPPRRRGHDLDSRVPVDDDPVAFGDVDANSLPCLWIFTSRPERAHASAKRSAAATRGARSPRSCRKTVGADHEFRSDCVGRVTRKLQSQVVRVAQSSGELRQPPERLTVRPLDVDRYQRHTHPA